MIPTPTKICGTCLFDKPITDFYKAKGNHDGHQNWCKKCDNIRSTDNRRRKASKNGKPKKVLTLVARELRLKGLKCCPGCKDIKPFDAFYKSKNTLATHCIVCTKKIARISKAPSNSKDAKHAKYVERRRAQRDAKLRRKFGISLIDYEGMLVMQNGVCAICGECDKKGLAVDHNHQTGAVRSLLCGRCNPAIGFLRESPELARKVAEYLEQYGA